MVGASDARKYLWDARRAAERITRFTDALKFSDYLDNEMLRSAVERQFAIIGEAFAALRRTEPNIAACIPELSRIISFRNVLIHGYAYVDDRLVWGVVESDLPGLLTLLTQLLAAAEH